MIDVDELLERHLAARASEAVPIDQWEAVLAGEPSIVSVGRPRAAARRPMLLVAAAVVAIAVSGIALIAVWRADPPRAADRAATDWSSSSVRFAAHSFVIETDGVRFTGEADDRDIGSSTFEDDGEYTVTWTEHGVEMRLNVYFARDDIEWWVTDIWTYDGNLEGEWLYATGERFRMPLGEAYVGDVDISLAAGVGALNEGATGRLVIDDMTLLPFTTVDIPAPAPMFNGEPPALPDGIPATGVAWTTRGSYVLELAMRIRQQDCMNRKEFEFDLMTEQLELGVGVWMPDDVLSVGTERAASRYGYRSLDPTTAPGPVEVATRGMTQTEVDVYMAALMGDDTAVNRRATGRSGGLAAWAKRTRPSAVSSPRRRRCGSTCRGRASTRRP